MKIGYARVSTPDQSFDLQLDALNKAGCEEIYREVASGAKTHRPQLDELLQNIREGDQLIIWKLDRLGRSLKHLVQLVGELMEKGVGLQSLNDPIDTTTPQGRLTFNIFACLAEFERDLIRERTQAGLSAARARGRLGGRPPGLGEKAKATAAAAETLYRRGEHSTSQIAKMLSISKSTLYTYLRHQGVEIGQKKAKVGETTSEKDSIPEFAKDEPERNTKSTNRQKEKDLVVFEMKITLLGVNPAIWRRFRVRSDLTLHHFHLVLQTVMGWRDSHLYL